MRLTHPVLLSIGFGLLAAPAFGAVKVGDPAAPIALDALIPAQPVENAALEALAGKAVVLEFWATWCGPCVAAIPHLNELADKFAGRPIQFLSVTDEEAAVIEKFLAARPIHGWVGFDRARSMWKAYGFEGVPVTVLIDASGKVAGIAHPETIKAGHLEDLLAGRAVKVAPLIAPNLPVLRSGIGEGPAPLLDIVVRPSLGGSQMTSGPGIHQWRGTTLRNLLSGVYGVNSAFVEVAGDDSVSYDVSVVGPRKQDEALQKMLPDLLSMAFQIGVRRETREAEGWVLTAPHGKPEQFNEAASSAGFTAWSGGHIRVIGETMEQLAGIAQSLLRKPVADRTGIAGRFDFDLEFDQSHPESFLDTLRKLGFALDPARLPVEYLVVTKTRATE